MNLTLLSATLGSGGAERGLLVLADAMAARGQAVSVVTWNGLVPDFYAVGDSVNRVRVEITGTPFPRWFDIVGNVRRLLAIRRAVRSTRPDVVISFLDGTNELFLLASLGERYAKLISCQVDITMHAHYNYRWRKLREWIYGLADCVVFLDSEQGREAARRFPRWSCTGIPNALPPIDTTPDEAARHVLHTLERFSGTIVAMGRLAPQKGFDLLLAAFAGIANRHPDWGLVILGEGPDREMLEARCRELRLEDRVRMPGQIAKPHAVIARCDVFAFSSRYEGQGLALVEALACGVPAVSFDCPSGPSLILKDGVSGYLVEAENVAAFRDALDTLIRETETRKRMARAAPDSVRRYGVEPICREWMQLFGEVRSPAGT